MQQDTQSKLSSERSAAGNAQADIDIKQAQGQQDIADTQATQARDLQTKRDAGIQDMGAFVPTKETGSDLAKMFAMVGALGFMSGGRGRDSGLAAMKNMSGAMKGYQEGKQDRFNQEMAEFRENLAATKQHNDLVDKMYRDAIDLLSKDRDAALAKLKVAATIDGKQSVLPHTLAVGDLTAALKFQDERQKAQDKLNEHMQTMQEQFQMKKALMELQEHARSGGGSELSPAALEMAATVYGKTGQLPPGMGKEAVRVRTDIINKWAEMGGTGEKTIRDRSDYRSGQVDLNALEKSYSAVKAFENTAIRNGDRLIQLANKVDQTGTPLIEKWIRSGRQATGDPDVSTFNAQMQIYTSEAAKILNNPTLSGQLTDSARHEVQGFLNGGSSAKQILSVVNLLKTDFENRKITLEDEIRDAQNRQTGTETPPASSPAPAVSPIPSGWQVTVH